MWRETPLMKSVCFIMENDMITVRAIKSQYDSVLCQVVILFTINRIGAKVFIDYSFL
jgi:hypothetical protein